MFGNIYVARPSERALESNPEIPPVRDNSFILVIDWPLRFTSVVAGFSVANSLKEGMLNWPVSMFCEKSAS